MPPMNGMEFFANCESDQPVERAPTVVCRLGTPSGSDDDRARAYPGIHWRSKMVRSGLGPPK